MCCQVFRPGDAILQIKISENCNYLLLLRSIMRRGSEERCRNLEYFAATRRFVGALSEKCAGRMMMTTLLRAQRAHEMRDSKHDPGGPREMNCRRVRRQMQKSDGRASDEKLCGRGCLKKINPQLRNAKKILQIFFFLRRICCGFLSFVVVVACLPLSSSLQQTLVFLPGICPVFLLLLFQFQTCCDFVLSFFRSLAICRGVWRVCHPAPGCYSTTHEQEQQQQQ